MRIMIKGGVWKNTEDEILKAAVMKYGLNQWSRISSLLVRKSAKQCKARWYEWLDPSIKKTEWTREEDEKLLHLAKLMPCQWRTIAPIVGRTPAQCLERYEKLLDMAVSKEDRYDPTDDPRRLRPGEIDPNPESKPARPDAVDMDEDEKEMLSEARARLANTRGKKAKRKAREKQLEEARRLASLQKKRELKAAGIELRGYKKRKGGVDYANEVVFEKKPAAGFFDTSGEDARAKALQLEFRPVTVEEMEGKKKKDVEEQLVKRDIKRAKLDENHGVARATQDLNDMNDPAAARRKSKMMLPAPQVTEGELEAIARMSTESDILPEVADGAGGDATRQLLGQYGPMPARTPQRTARTAATGDRLMMEAQNQARLTAMETPLFGGENPELHPSDFSGMTPRGLAPSATPNPLSGMTPRTGGPGATPAGHSNPSASTLGGPHRHLSIAGVPSTPSASIGGTPLRSGTGSGGMLGATPLRTPLRDELGLNDGDAALMGGINYGGGFATSAARRAEAARAAAFRVELRGALGSLPAPQNEYMFAAPALPEDDEAAEGDGMEEDAADAKARRAREAEAKRLLEESKKSQALQRGLPRPASLDQLRPPKSVHELGQLSLKERAEEMQYAEYLRLLSHDQLKYPAVKADGKDKKGSKRSAAAAPALGPTAPLEDVSPQALTDAASLIKAEVSFLVRAMGHEAVAPEEYSELAVGIQRDLLFIPGKGRYERLASATPTERTESIKSRYDAVRKEMDQEARKAERINSKVGILLGGLMARDSKLREQLGTLWEEGLAKAQELACFQALRERELRAAPERIEALVGLVSAAQSRESALQERFKQLSAQKEDLLAGIKAAQQPQKQIVAA